MHDLSGITLPDNIFVLDFETTGIDTKTCEPCELAILNKGKLDEWFIRTIKPIPPEVSAIHHIIDSDVEKWSDWLTIKAQLAQYLANARLSGTMPILVAHNAEYDKAVLGMPDQAWICTYKCSLVVWPDAPAHKNEVLRYWLKLGDDRGREHAQNSHTAGHDVVVTARLLMELLKHRSLETLIQISALPAKLPYMPFGKHFKKPWNEIDSGYLNWILKQADMDVAVKTCAEQELRSRR